VLYEKGSIILSELEARVGKDKFSGFLKEFVSRRIKITKDLLDLLEKTSSKETRFWLENKLKTA
jgi:aminopeptidase N